MKQYKGLYIDHVFFHSEQDIDKHLEQLAIHTLKTLVELFEHNPNHANALALDEQAQRLHDRFGYEWDEIERLEISFMA